MVDFAISDLHFNHKNIVANIQRPDGRPLRGFPDMDTMNNTIINNINSVVNKHDRLFILGDVAIPKSGISLMGEINCENCYLIGGNHDTCYSELSKYFRKIYGCFEYNHSILTHIPVHDSQKYRFKYNIHGHLHYGYVSMKVPNPGFTGDGTETVPYTIDVPDPFYKCISCEMVNYTPVNLQQITEA